MEGDHFWFRDDVGGFNTSVTRFPGYTLRFESHKFQQLFVRGDEQVTCGGRKGRILGQEALLCEIEHLAPPETSMVAINHGDER